MRACLVPRQFITALIGITVAAGFSIAATTAPATLPSSSEKLATGDRLSIGIVGLNAPDQKTTYTPLIEKDGKIGLPRVQPLDANGLTKEQLVKEIKKAYEDAYLIKDADVTVDVAESHDAPSTGRGPLKLGDQIVVRICDIEKPGQLSSFSRQIDDQGEIQIPYVEQPIRVANLTEREAADTIVKELKKENLINKAQVDVVRAPQ